ncbi:trimeric intracellular cation channel family protein [Acidithiobacillus sp. AMEEHan]|uniref:trimeric intracellular cation channel family protein n=1 Tax=Acidithiobacillus sp. AMEEHan TaxID=2994951 RepID=UPI0027E48ADB|nr:trimeric intracellular cation channel family protein [Acidithiobacillus sp. AMEEHan]
MRYHARFPFDTFAMHFSLFLDVFNFIGIFVFAVSGAMRGVRAGLDIFGIVVLAVVTAVSGGIVRDVLIGAIPPQSIRDWHGIALAVVAGLLVFFFHRLFERMQYPVLLFDAAGLGLFAVTGTQKALDYGLAPEMAAVLGMISGIGGGMVRDVLTAQVPVVLRGDIYASAALLGAVLLLGGDWLQLPAWLSLLLGASCTFILRTLSIYRHWTLPHPR